MCLLIAMHRVHSHGSLIAGANRDELLARPAVPMMRWDDRPPRRWAGRDVRAGGTWLALNEHGVFAGVTNQPGLGRDPSRKSRGEWPLVLTDHKRAVDAAAAFVASAHPGDYSPGWVLVGDGETLSYIDMTGTEPEVITLPPGVHVLENVPYGVESPKVRAVRAAVEAIVDQPWEAARPELESILRSHAIPPGADQFERVLGLTIPPETHAPCVHAGPYGTRTSALMVVDGGKPREIAFTDGPPCTHPYQEVSLAR